MKTPADFARMGITDPETQRHLIMCDRVLDAVAKVDGLDEEDPVTGVAMLRAGCTALVLLGATAPSCRKLVVDTCAIFEPPLGKAPVMPNIPTGKALTELSKRCALVAGAALRHEPSSDASIVALHVGVTYLRFAAYTTEIVVGLFDACWKDSEAAVADLARAHGRSS